MYRSLGIFALGPIALVLSIFLAVLPFQLTDDLKEIERFPTICSLPIISPSFNLTSVQTRHISKGQVDIEVAVLLKHPGISGLGNRIEYNVTLKPLDDWYSIVSKVDTGRVTVKDQAIVSAHFSIPKHEATSHKSWELEVSADAEPSVGSSSGVDRVYVSFLNQTAGDPVAIVTGPAEYWHSKILDLKRTNFTLPTFEQDENLECACEKTTWLPRQQLRLPPDGPDPPLPHRRFTIDIQVVYEDPNGLLQALANARVGLFSSDNTQRIPDWTYRLNGFGRATAAIVTPIDYLPVAAKVFFDDTLFTLKEGPDRSNLRTWEFDLNLSQTGSRISVTGQVPQSIGPDIGHVWGEWHRIRRNGESDVGLEGVPHIDVWFPANAGSSSYTPNFIALLSARSRLPEVYAHEYGHHVMHSLMRGGIPTGGSGDHVFCSTNADLILSWKEGYATAFGLRVLGLRSYRGQDLEALSCPANRDMLTDEGRVAAGLLDLMDDEGSHPECAGTNPDLGRPGFCDRTSGSLFTPYIVLRYSIVGPQLGSVTAWWERLSAALRNQPGIADGWEAMRYNYYPLPPCRLRWRGICLDFIGLPILWTPPRWTPGPLPPRTSRWPFPTPRPPVRGDL